MNNEVNKRSLLFLGLLMALSFCLADCREKKGELQPLSEKWEKAIPNQEIPKGLTSLSAEQCGVCHQQHYKEWKQSTHAYAWVDLQFQAELKKESSPFLCVNCHIPLQNQQEYIIGGLYDGDIYRPKKTQNPHFDPNLRQEGVTCASCHIRNNTVIGPGRTTGAPHVTKTDTLFLSEKLCMSCHNASAVITPTLACTFETGDEWKKGPYFGKKNCIDCHMEQVERKVVPGAGVRKSRYHFFPGSGIPKTNSHKPHVLNGLSFSTSDIKKVYNVGDTFYYHLTLKNEFAGHKVPTGDPERFFEISFFLTDTAGNQLSAIVDTIGERWQWYPEAKKLSENNLLPDESRKFKFSYPLEQKGAFRLLVRVEKHRLDQESATYNKLGEEYPLFITIFDEEYPVLVR